MKNLIKRETKKEFGSYLLDISKFIVAGVYSR